MISGWYFAKQLTAHIATVLIMSMSAMSYWKIANFWENVPEYGIFPPWIAIYVGNSIGNWSMWKIDIKEIAATAILCIAVIFPANICSLSSSNFISLGFGLGSMAPFLAPSWMEFMPYIILPDYILGWLGQHRNSAQIWKK